MSDNSIHLPLEVTPEDRNQYFMRKATADKLEAVDVSNFHRYVTGVSNWVPQSYQKNGSRYSVYVDNNDPNSGEKKMSIHHAVQLVTSKGFKLPADSRFYLSNSWDMLNQAFHFNGTTSKVCWVTLGPSATKGGSGRGVSSQDSPGYASATKIALHEMGHMFHAHNVGHQRFYSDTRLREKNPGVGGQVSEYARNNIAKEIIAETFTGMMIGREYAGNVMQFYAIKGGPRVMGRFGIL